MNIKDLKEEDADKYVKSIMSAYGGVENSIKPMRTQIQGAAKDYSLLNSYMDNANYIGYNFSLFIKKLISKFFELLGNLKVQYTTT